MKTIRTTITLNEDKHRALGKQADDKGMPLPTYMRMLLSEFAEVPTKILAKQAKD